MSAAFDGLPEPRDDFPLEPDWPEDFVKVFGQLALRYAALDYELRLWVKTLLGAQFHAGMAVAQSTRYLGMLSDLVYALSTLDANNRRQRILQNHLKKMQKINQERNELTHNFWSIDKTNGKITRIAIKLQGPGLKHERKQYSVQDLKDRANRLRKLINSLEKLRQKPISS